MSVYMYLQAGLCNQLFMIFTLVSYAIDNKIQYKIVSKKNQTLNGTKTYWNNFLYGFKDSIIDIEDLKDYKIYNEPKYSYSELPKYLLDEKYILKGFFQSYKYFDHNIDKIKNIMMFDDHINNIKKEYIIPKGKTIAIHFRIGDYIGLQEYHCIKKPEYYIYAIKRLENDLKQRNENIKDYNILYFCQNCDDEYINKYINIINNITNLNLNFVRIPENIDDWKQLLIMSLCDHFIIANSTFSWFGAYFSKNEKKLVYYPQKWFGPALVNNDISDLCQNNWISI